MWRHMYVNDQKRTIATNDTYATHLFIESQYIVMALSLMIHMYVKPQYVELLSTCHRKYMFSSLYNVKVWANYARRVHIFCECIIHVLRIKWLIYFKQHAFVLHMPTCSQLVRTGILVDDTAVTIDSSPTYSRCSLALRLIVRTRWPQF